MLLRQVPGPDLLGGPATLWAEVATFTGAVAFVRHERAESGGRTAAVETAWLAHDPALALRPGDRLRRLRDGALFLVRGDAAATTAPAHSSLRFAQTPLERVVIP